MFYFEDIDAMQESSLLSKSIITESDESSPEFTTENLDCFSEVDEGTRANQIRQSIKEI